MNGMNLMHGMKVVDSAPKILDAQPLLNIESENQGTFAVKRL
jgi:hypothetical protein